MKILFMLFTLSCIGLIYAQDIPYKINELKQELKIESHSDGSCLYTRKELVHFELNRLFSTSIPQELSDLQSENIVPYWNCIFITRNLKRDSNKSFINYNDFQLAQNTSEDKVKEIKGKIRYLGLKNKKYHYIVQKRGTNYIATVKVHFNNKAKNFSRSSFESILSTMDDKIKEAQRHLNSNSPRNYQFKLIRVREAKDAFFSVKLLKNHTRGPYDKKWSMLWSKETIAHEFLHMMGLDDEYDNFSHTFAAGKGKRKISQADKEKIFTYALQEANSTFNIELDALYAIWRSSENEEKARYARDIEKIENNKELLLQKLANEKMKLYLDSYSIIRANKCDGRSVMCDSRNGRLKKWHYYTIFKRFFL